MAFTSLFLKEICLKLHPHKRSHMTFCPPLNVLRNSNLRRVPQGTFAIRLVISIYQ